MVGVGHALAQSNAPAATARRSTGEDSHPSVRPDESAGGHSRPRRRLDIEANQIILKQALDWGVTCWDTSGGSNAGRSERGIGNVSGKKSAGTPGGFPVNQV